MLRRILKYQEGQNDPDFDIFEAAYAGLASAVSTLLKGGVDPNSTDGNGWTPLMYAAYGGHTLVVRLLLEAGAQIQPESHGATALWWAREKGYTEVVRLLEQESQGVPNDHRRDPPATAEAAPLGFWTVG